jgi:hypothetical protein
MRSDCPTLPSGVGAHTRLYDPEISLSSGRLNIRVKTGHKGSKKLGVQKGCRRIVKKCLFSQKLATCLFASEKVNFSGQKCFFHMENAPWQPWYGQENSGMRLFTVPFELTVAASDPCDRFLHVSSTNPLVDL